MKLIKILFTAVVLGYSSELEGKYLLLKTPKQGPETH